MMVCGSGLRTKKYPNATFPLHSLVLYTYLFHDFLKLPVLSLKPPGPTISVSLLYGEVARNTAFDGPFHRANGYTARNLERQ